MGILTTTAATTALLSGSAYLLRRRISRNWITPSSIPSPSTRPLTPNQLCVITGGNAGLGLETARDLATRGAKVILACRDPKRGEEEVASLRESTGNDHVECMDLDLGSFASVRKFAEDLKHKIDTLQVDNTDSASHASTIEANEKNEKSGIYALICNAGVWMPMDQQQKTTDGYEIHFGVNHLGHFQLIHSLVPYMKQSGVDGRIVIVSSSLSKSGKIDMSTQNFVHEGRLPDPDKKASFAPTGYCDSKLMNTLTCRQLATTLEGTNLTTYSVCPGFCRSQLGRNVQVPFYKKMMMVPIMRLVQRTSVQGAQNIIFAAVEDKENLVNGRMYKDGKIGEEEEKFVDGLGGDLQKELWDLSEKLVGEKGGS